MGAPDEKQNAFANAKEKLEKKLAGDKKIAASAPEKELAGSSSASEKKLGASEPEKMLGPAQEKIPAHEKKPALPAENWPDKYARLQAEFDNYQKRTAKEKHELRQCGGEQFVLKILPVYEELEKAAESATKTSDKHLGEGVLMLYAKLHGILQKEGLFEVKALGEKFDPFRHEAVMREPSEKAEGTVTRVIQKGYLFNGKLLRHAVVGVSSGNDGKKEGKEEKKE